MRVYFSSWPTRTLAWEQRIVRADTQRKLLGFYEVAVPHYRCIPFFVVDLMKLKRLLFQ